MCEYHREIQESIAVSRGSLSRWLRNVQLTPEQQERIHQKNLVIRSRFVEYNQRRSVRIQSEKASLIAQCSQAIGGISLRELQLIGAALYWAEGYKAPTASLVVRELRSSHDLPGDVVVSQLL